VTYCRDVSSDVLRGLVGDVLGVSVTSVGVSRSRHTSSFPIDNLTVTVETGEILLLVRKDLSWGALDSRVRAAKPRFLHDPRREMGMYRLLLAGAPAGTARWYGNVDRPDLGYSWLLIEQISGAGLCETGELERWAACARWLAELHAAFSGSTEALRSSEVPLLVHDRAWLRRWADRAVASTAPTSATCAIRHVHRCVDVLSERLAVLPVTLVHGEFYASNVMVAGAREALRVCPVDWEMAALAPALSDLAALTSGDLAPSMRTDIERAYCATAGRTYDDEFVAELDVCRLAQCVQWLGWMPGWQPAAHHRYDWLGEAVRLVDRLAL
jgi:hypothetical protein